MNLRTLAMALAAALSVVSHAGKEHQRTEGEAAYTSNGKSAQAVKQIEVKSIEGAGGGQVGRVKASMNQWGFVSYWFGIPTPAGKSTIRFRIYVDGSKTSTYGIYTVSKAGQKTIRKLEIPANAKSGTFVTINVPVESEKAWSGIALKKMDGANKPGPWIDSIATILSTE